MPRQARTPIGTQPAAFQRVRQRLARRKTKKRYSPADRSKVLADLALTRSPTQTSRNTGIPARTIERWRDLANAQHLTPSPERLDAVNPSIVVAASTDWGQVWGEVEALAIERLRQMIPRATSIRDLAIAGGIASDKRIDHQQGRRGQTVAQQEQGKHLHVHLGEGMADKDKAELLGQVAGRLADRPNPANRPSESALPPEPASASENPRERPRTGMERMFESARAPQNPSEQPAQAPVWPLRRAGEPLRRPEPQRRPE